MPAGGRPAPLCGSGSGLRAAPSVWASRWAARSTWRVELQQKRARRFAACVKSASVPAAPRGMRHRKSPSHRAEGRRRLSGQAFGGKEEGGWGDRKSVMEEVQVDEDRGQHEDARCSGCREQR
eukprot:scaffold99557_cov33-Tisochrysis_lutea.AAC.2